jgi:plastocyanin
LSTRLAAQLLMVAALVASPVAASAQGSGIIEGTVHLAAQQSRRTASRYPASGTAHEVQRLPAIAYIVGPIATEGEATPASTTMAQRDTAFVPSLVAVRRGGSVAFPNGDSFFHNVFSYSSAQRFDLGRYPQGESKSVTFVEPGIVEIFCEVHEFMRGAVLVAENPFHAVVSADGTFRITGVPAGEHRIAFWQADHRPVERRVTVTGGGTVRIEVELTR